MTQLLLDAHVHLYPNFNLATAFDSAILHFAAWRKQTDAQKLLLLTERSDCDFFNLLKNEKAVQSYSVKCMDEAEAIELVAPNQQKLFVIAGRQVVTRESLEICALATLIAIKDRQYSAAEVIQQVLQAGGVAALNWAPGKWLFKRGKIVVELLQMFTPLELLIGDTSMRPTFWSTPGLMQRAIQDDFKIIAGSDPLPFSGEEKNIGRYGCTLHAEWQEKKPAASIRAALRNSETIIERVGHRSASLDFVGRQIRIMREKKNRT
jgi:hypothetical protein